jgi:hypothetical protein
LIEASGEAGIRLREWTETIEQLLTFSATHPPERQRTQSKNKKSVASE